MNRWRFWLAQGVWGFAGLILLSAFSGAYPNNSPVAGMIIIGLAFLVSGFLLRWGNEENARPSQSTNIIVRVMATIFLWITYLGGVIAGAQEMGGLIIVLALILMVPLLAMTTFIWLWERINKTVGQKQLVDDQDMEKRKRDRIDRVLRDMSDDDLIRLRERLAGGTIREEHLRYMLDSDGELVLREN